jgi:hypothetical protein
MAEDPPMAQVPFYTIPSISVVLVDFVRMI